MSNVRSADFNIGVCVLLALFIASWADDRTSNNTDHYERKNCVRSLNKHIGIYRSIEVQLIAIETFTGATMLRLIWCWFITIDTLAGRWQCIAICALAYIFRIDIIENYKMFYWISLKIVRRISPLGFFNGCCYLADWPIETSQWKKTHGIDVECIMLRVILCETDWSWHLIITITRYCFNAAR